MEAKNGPSDWFRVEMHDGPQVRAGELTLTPVSRSVRLLLPGRNGGFIWNRPIHVDVRDGEGNLHTLVVHDTTRQLQLLLLGAGFLFSLLFWLAFRQRRNHDE